MVLFLPSIERIQFPVRNCHCWIQGVQGGLENLNVFLLCATIDVILFHSSPAVAQNLFILCMEPVNSSCASCQRCPKDPLSKIRDQTRLMERKARDLSNSYVSGAECSAIICLPGDMAGWGNSHRWHFQSVQRTGLSASPRSYLQGQL